MNTLKKISFVLIIHCLCYTSTLAQVADLPSMNQVTLNSIGDQIMSKGNILGLSVAIAKKDSIVYSKGFGYIDAEKTMRVTNATRFDIASISKLIGVIVIMKLVEQGKLNLGQTLDELLPSFPEKKQASRITLEHLLSHRSGLQDYTLEFDSDFITKGEKPGMLEYLEFFRGKELVSEPGSSYKYNNSGFLLMAYIAEHNTGKTWQALINELINEPTGLDFKLIKHVADSPNFSPIFDYGNHKIQIPIKSFKKGQFDQIRLWDYVIGDGG